MRRTKTERDAQFDLAQRCGLPSYCLDEIDRLRADLEDAEGQALKLQAFKDWVHNYLDAHGVPHHPPGTHGEAGCRIGDRMDWLMAKLEDAEREIAEIGRGEFRQKPLATEAGGE